MVNSLPLSAALALEGASGSSVMASCGIEAFAVLQIPLGGIHALRQNPGPVSGPPLAPNFLKYSDEQTVVGLAAVYHVIHDFHLDSRGFSQWGVLAAPCFAGRVGAAEAIHKCQQGGLQKASPLAIPCWSLHAPACTITLALQMHGPSFGAGGGLGGVSEVLLAALTVLDESGLPGLWVVLTQWFPEPIPNLQGSSLVPTNCQAVALACVPAAADRQGSQLQLVRSVTPGSAANLDNSDQFIDSQPNVAALARFLSQGFEAGSPQTWVCPLSWGCNLKLTRDAGIARGVLPTMRRKAG